MILLVGSGAIAGIILGSVVIVFFAVIIAYVIEGLVYYKIFKKAGVNNPWLAWVPIGILWPLFDTAKIRRVHIWWVLAPSIIAGLAFITRSPALMIIGMIFDIAPLIVGIIIAVRLLKAFSISLWWLLLFVGLAIPIISIIAAIALVVLLFYIAFSSKVQYNPNFNIKSSNQGPNIDA